MLLRRTRPALLALLAALALGLAACGGSDNNAGMETTTAPAQTGGMHSGHAAMADAGMDPAVALRSTLERALGEHAVLAMIATQKGYAGDADFEAAAKALDRNSVEVAAAIGSVYGKEAGKEFLDGPNMWRAHIGFFVDYTVGLATKNTAMQEKAVGDLMGYIETNANFLARATGLPLASMRASITEHVMQLKGQIDAYAAGNYDRAYRLFRHAYHHMVMTADVLADAIVKQNPEMFSK